MDPLGIDPILSQALGDCSLSGHRKTYVLSMITAGNGTPVGEPSFVAEVLLLTGLIQGKAPSSDNDEVLTMIGGASSADLRLLLDGEEWGEIKARMSRAYGGPRIVDYIEKRLQTAEVIEASTDGQLDPVVMVRARREFLALMEMLAGRPSTTRDSRLVTGEGGREKIGQWAAELKGHIAAQVAKGPLAPPEQAQKVDVELRRIIDRIDSDNELTELLSGHGLEPRHIEYVRGLVRATATSGGVNSAESLVAYQQKKDTNVRSKARPKGMHWDTLAERIGAMSTQEKLRFLNLRRGGDGNVNAATASLEAAGLDSYIAHLKVQGVPKGTRSRIRSAFTFGAAATTTVKGGTYSTLVRYKVGATHTRPKTVRRLLHELHPSELLQVSRDGDLMNWIGDKLGTGSPDYANLASIGLPGHLRRWDREETAIDHAANQATMRTAYWASKFNLVLSRKRPSRKVLFSLIRQTYNVARRIQTLPFTKEEYPKDVPQDVDPVDPKVFLQRVLGGIGQDQQEKMRTNDDFSPVYHALNDGRLPTMVEQALSVSKRFSQLGWLRGAFITPSAFMQMVNETEGSALLTEWTNFHEFRHAARAFRDAGDDVQLKDVARARLRRWILQPKPNKVEYLRRMLP